MSDKFICEDCGAENFAKFGDSIDAITFNPIVGEECAFVTCWKCNILFMLSRKKSFGNIKYKHKIIARA